MVREKVKENISGYIQSPKLDKMEDYIVPPALGDEAGLTRALELGKRAAEKP